MIDRRRFLKVGALGAGAIWVAPQMAFASVATERRFVFVIQRGAADGLNTVVPYADPAYARLRGAIAIDPSAAIKLDGTFALHPSLENLGKRYAEREALFVHAVASPYRERSHFDGQNVLETGGNGPYQLKDGWLNRLAAQLPRTGDKPIAFAPTIPLALRGATDVSSFATSTLPEAPDDLLTRVGRLYETDAQLHGLWTAAMETRSLASDAQARQDPAGVGRTAAGFLSRPNGPRIAMIETGGWDTHAGEVARLGNQLKALDVMLDALRTGMGDHWKQTTVLVATEFGRTAAVNGTGGTDHGTASAAMVLGGSVKGGRVVSDWPGLANNALYEGRDLRPTIDLDVLIASLAAQSLGLDPAATLRATFPGRPASRLIEGLLA
ncbi:DUF1501 domain-containing protein [soil metagenome]